MSVRQSPMGMPAKPTAAPFDVVPMIRTYLKIAACCRSDINVE